MFFIVPDKANQTGISSAESPNNSAESTSKRKRLNATTEDGIGSYYPKRVAKACDRCRLKKAKCTGGQVCARCKQDGVVCVTLGNSKKDDRPLNPAYVHLVESQRDLLARALYNVMQDQNSEDSTKLKETLSKMGITTDALRLSREASGSDTNNALLQDPEPSELWTDIFDNFDGDQLQQIESLCATDLQFEEMFPPMDPNQQMEELQFLQASPNKNQSDDVPFEDVSFWGQEAHIPVEPWKWTNGTTADNQDPVATFSDNYTLDPRTMGSNDMQEHRI